MLQRESLRAAAREILARQIVRGELSAGAPINLAELASTVGVSVTPLREALIELERDGLVHSILNRGYFVRPLDEAEMRELYPIVAALEVLALRSGAPSEASMRKLAAINEQLRHEHSPAKCIDLDDRWHSTLLADCRNATLLSLLPPLKHRLYRYEYAFMSHESVPAESARQHDRIAEAIRKGRMEQAASLLEKNWAGTPAAFAAARDPQREGDAHAQPRRRDARLRRRPPQPRAADRSGR